MKPNERPAIQTVLTFDLLWNEFLLQWEDLGVNPTRAAVELKIAHVALETGLKKCFCWNGGNQKWTARSGLPFCMFACNEQIPISMLEHCKKLGPVLKVSKPYQRNGEPWVQVDLAPPHPWTRFLAFDSIDDWVAYQIRYLKDPKRADVLAALMTGDPKEYSDALAKAHYYTANPAKYRDGLVRELKVVHAALDDADWTDVPER
jgi:hypothetical protein